MDHRFRRLAALLFAGAAGVAAWAPARAGDSLAASTDDRLKALEQELQDVNSELADLKRSQSDQYGDVNRQIGGFVQVKLDNGRPTFTSADGNFSIAIHPHDKESKDGMSSYQEPKRLVAGSIDEVGDKLKEHMGKGSFGKTRAPSMLKAAGIAKDEE
jgi:hypothetical protein